MAEKIYIISSPFEIGQKVSRKINDYDETFVVVGFVVNYANDRGDVVGYDILLSDMDGSIMSCKPFEIVEYVPEKGK